MGAGGPVGPHGSASFKDAPDAICSARTGTGHIGLNANTPVSHLGLSQDNLLRLHS
jgi:hypothetical protein